MLGGARYAARRKLTQTMTKRIVAFHVIVTVAVIADEPVLLEPTAPHPKLMWCPRSASVVLNDFGLFSALPFHFCQELCEHGISARMQQVYIVEFQES